MEVLQDVGEENVIPPPKKNKVVNKSKSPLITVNPAQPSNTKYAMKRNEFTLFIET